MSVLVISDVHADICAFEAILSITTDKRFMQKYSEVEMILNLGDTVERGYHPREVIDKLKALETKLPVISLRGNHDEALLLDRPVSGSDMRSREAHANPTAYVSFLRALPDCYLNRANHVLAVHGGPIDPSVLGNDWLYGRSWQRISSRSYLDASGYHYTPREAFEHVKQTYGAGYVILCGHDHDEAAYSDRLGDLLKVMRAEQSRYAGYRVTSLWITRDPSTSYLVRVGIAGPEGYHRVGRERSHFGLMWRHNGRERIGLFSFTPIP
ncbi:MAG: metallophosphoesterase [Euryarchaeota archaeon]|nr:metallophosphoesterase [Euryarchaeota archaeon]